MVISVETTLQHPKRGFIKLEDTVAVTDTGFEIYGEGARGWNRAGTARRADQPRRAWSAAATREIRRSASASARASRTGSTRVAPLSSPHRPCGAGEPGHVLLGRDQRGRMPPRQVQKPPGVVLAEPVDDRGRRQPPPRPRPAPAALQRSAAARRCRPRRRRARPSASRCVPAGTTLARSTGPAKRWRSHSVTGRPRRDGRALVDDDGVGQLELELERRPQRACRHHQAVAEAAAAVDDGDRQVLGQCRVLQAVVHDDDGHGMRPDLDGARTAAGGRGQPASARPWRAAAPRRRRRAPRRSRRSPNRVPTGARRSRASAPPARGRPPSGARTDGWRAASCRCRRP